MTTHAKHPDVEINRLVTHLNNMYAERREPLAIEPYQNSIDAYAENVTNSRVPSDRPLSIETKVDTQRNKYVVRDNSGGFTDEGWENATKIAESDKKDSDGGGDMGIGLWAVTEKVEYIIVESYTYSGDHRCLIIHGANVDNPRRYRVAKGKEKIEKLYGQYPVDCGARINPENEPTGTVFEATGVSDEAMDILSDFTEMSNIIKKHFPVLAEDNVTLEFSVDNDTGEMISPPKLDEVAGTRYIEGKSERFTDSEHGRERQINGITVADCKTSPPWNRGNSQGIALFKTHEHFDEPVMLVNTYNPKVAGLRGDDPDIVSWAVVDDLCREPTLEDPSHQRIKVRWSKETNLKEYAMEVYREHYVEESTSENQQIFDNIKEGLDQLFSSADEDLIKQFTVPEKEGLISSGSDNTGSVDLVRCTGQREEFSSGEIMLGYDVLCPEDPTQERILIWDIRVVESGSNSVVEEFEDKIVEVHPDKIAEKTVLTTITKPGFYEFRLQATRIPNYVQDISSWKESTTPEDRSKVIFSVDKTFGEDHSDESTESEPAAKDDRENTDSDRSDTDGDDNPSSLIREIRHVSPDTRQEEQNHRLVSAKSHPDGGFTLLINRDHEEWKKPQEKYSQSDTRIQKQTKAVMEKGLPVILREIEEQKRSDLIHSDMPPDELEEKSKELKDDVLNLKARIEMTSDYEAIIGI